LSVTTRLLHVRTLAAALLLLLLFAAAYGFAAANTVPESGAGDGAGAPNTVKAKLVSTSATYATCTLSGTTWTCPVTGVTALAADELRVIAAQ
jgi:hypothetical protein